MVTPLPPRVLVTGASGFAGSHLLDLLAAEDLDIWALHRSRSRTDNIAASESPPATVRWVHADLLDRRQMRALIRDIRPEMVYHCAGAAHVASSWTDTATPLEVNVLGTHHVLDALTRAGLQSRVVVPGSATVYAPSDQAISEENPLAATSPYGISKLAQEMLGTRAALSGEQPVVVARAFNHTGPRQDPSYAASSFARQIARIEAGVEEATIEVGNLDARRDVTDVRDTVRAYRLMMQYGVPGRVYNVCSGHAPAMREILDALLALAHVPVTVRQDPSRLRPSDSPLLIGNPERIRRELGWTPRIPLDRTLRDLLEHWRRRVGEPQAR